MEAEDHEAQQMDECVDSSDDEAYPVPTQWREEGFGNPVIQDGRCQEWEYPENEVVQGAKYKTIEDVKDAVKRWAVSLRREFRVVKSGSKEYEVECLKDGCPWRVHAYKGRWKTHWVCSIVTEHTCVVDGVQKMHRNMTSTFVAEQIYGLVLNKLDYEPKLIVRHIEQNF